uniref:Calmodulin-lysine N-methyltransferase n=1 Tax=Chlamydomonas euryale TaxID=1486919 RepID=A0A7R9Z8M0_9CHLO|mmetsp:Transcript_8291/g.25059  ORF Transcript_8291/g.25059 Transcript_8291/m.25059 type:complete len:296 (+) Transcript_8291:136-1023(+)
MAAGRGGDAAWSRMNCHDTTLVEQEVMGHIIRLSQNPASEHLGTTVWDASIVLAKYLEKNMRKGEFSRPRLKGKRVLELGAGMGLGGMAFALLDANVVLTDTVDVVPLLKRNCEANLGCGTVQVRELDWYQPDQVLPLNPPFDYVIAADCIYHEHIVEQFHRTVMDVTNDKSIVLVVNELRSHSVHSAFMSAFEPTHVIKIIPHSKMDDFFQHPNIQIFYMKKLKPKKAKYASSEAVSTASVHPGSTPLAEAADSLSEHDDDHGGLSPAPKQMADGQGGLEAVVRQTEGLSIHTP